VKVFPVGADAGGRPRSWTVVGDDFAPIEPIDSYLALLQHLERSPNTVKAYAYDLKSYWGYLQHARRDWREVTVDDVAGFVRSLRMPANVVTFTEQQPQRSTATVNRALSSVFSFYDYHQRRGVPVAERLVQWRGGQRTYKAFMHHAVKDTPLRGRALRLREEPKLPQRLSTTEVTAILEACTHLRDRLLFRTMYETGLRVGQVLGLRHEDWRSWDKVITVVARDGNPNGARSKSRGRHEVPMPPALVRLYSDYMHEEYGDLDCDFIFVNLWAAPFGSPMTYSTVNHIVQRLRTKTGVYFTPHMTRHSAASNWIAAGVPAAVVSRLLTHASQTSMDAYIHLSVEELRTALLRAGTLTPEEWC